MKTYYIEFKVYGTCGAFVEANSEEEAKEKLDDDDIELNEWNIGELEELREEKTNG